MKRILLFALVMLLTSASVVPVLAAPQTAAAPRGAFALVGKITAIGENTITVKVWRGNTLVRKYIGQELTIEVTENTRFYFKQGTTTQPIKFSDLGVGQKVSVTGRTANNVWKAFRVTVSGAKFALVGKITAIGDDTVTVKVWRGNIFVRSYRGEELTITVTDATRFLLRIGTTITKITFADLKVGQKVTVNGYVKNNIWKASKITVAVPQK